MKSTLKKFQGIIILFLVVITCSLGIKVYSDSEKIKKLSRETIYLRANIKGYKSVLSDELITLEQRIKVLEKRVFELDKQMGAYLFERGANQ